MNGFWPVSEMHSVVLYWYQSFQVAQFPWSQLYMRNFSGQIVSFPELSALGVLLSIPVINVGLEEPVMPTQQPECWVALKLPPPDSLAHQP